MIFEFCGLSRCVTRGRGEGGEKKEKHSPYDLEHETLQGVSSCCAKTHIRTYDVTPDLSVIKERELVKYLVGQIQELGQEKTKDASHLQT